MFSNDAINHREPETDTFPLLFRGETIGVFESVNKRNGQKFTNEDITTLETLASQAAVAILSNLLFDKQMRLYYFI